MSEWNGIFFAVIFNHPGALVTVRYRNLEGSMSSGFAHVGPSG